MYDLRSAGFWGRFAWVATAISLVACQLQPTSMPTRGVLRSSPAVGPAAMTAPRKLQSVTQAKHPRRAPGIARDYAPHTGPKQNLRFHMANGRLVQDPMAPPQARHLLDTPGDGCDPALPEDTSYLGDFATCADNPDGPGYQPTITSHWYIYTFTSPDIPGTWNLVMAHVTATSPCGTVETDTAPWYGFPLEDVIANPDTYIEEHYAWTCDDDSDPSPSPSPSASPSPSTPPNSPGPSDPPSPSPSPSPPSPTPPPSASPSVLPPPPGIELAADRAFSPDHDGGDHIKVKASGAWQVVVQGYESTPIGTNLTGGKSFRWDGTIGGQRLPDGDYTLVLSANGQTANVFSYLDGTGPKVTNMQFAHAATDPTATGTAYNLTATIQGDVIPVDSKKLPPEQPPLGDFDPMQEDAYTVNVTGGVTSEQEPSFDSGSLTLNKPITANLAELHKKTMTVTLTATDMLGNKTTVKYYPGFLFAKKPAFAPGSQSTAHRTDALTVSKGDGWTLQVDNQGFIQQGTGLTDIAWDGSVKPDSDTPPATLHVLDLSTPSKILKDGQYTLQLSPGGAAPSPSDPTATVVIDTKPPEFTLSIDGVEHPDVIDDQVPTIRASLKATPSGFDGLNCVTTFSFSQRQDGSSAAILDSAKSFDSTQNIFTYKVPANDANILFGGDQTLDIVITDEAGNQTEKKLAFAVGEHSLWAGIQLTDSVASSSSSASAYKLTSVDQIYDNPNLEKYNNPAYKITLLDPDPVLARELPLADAEPITEEGLPARVFPYIARGTGAALADFFGLYLVTNSISGDTVSYVYADDESASIKQLIKKGRYFRVNYNNFDGIDFIAADSETYRHIISQRGHNEVGPTNLATALYNLKKTISGEESSKVEFWKNPTPKPKANNRALKNDRLLIASYNGNIFQIIIQNKAISGQYIRTAFSSGRHPGDTTFPTLQNQWSSAVKKVASFEKKDNPLKLWAISQRSPQYPNWLTGEITDDGAKTYTISKPQRIAVARFDRIISQ